jgi:hypothetical protein
MTPKCKVITYKSAIRGVTQVIVRLPTGKAAAATARAGEIQRTVRRLKGQLGCLKKRRK